MDFSGVASPTGQDGPTIKIFTFSVLYRYQKLDHPVHSLATPLTDLYFNGKHTSSLAYNKCGRNTFDI